MEFFAGLIVVVLDIIAIVDAIRGSLPTEKKILWALLIILLPVIGLVLYYLLGRPGK